MRRALCFPAILLLFAGCANSERGIDDAVVRILKQPAKDVVSNVTLNVMSSGSTASNSAEIAAGRRFDVSGRFRTIGDAAQCAFRPDAIVVEIVKKNRDGLWVTYGFCNCDVSGSAPDFEFGGTIEGVANPGVYVLQARYMGELLAELPITVRRGVPGNRDALP